MKTPEQLVSELLSPMADAAAAFDGLVTSGASAVPALAAALERGRAVPQLTAALCALTLPDPVAVLAPLLETSDTVRDAALRALGAHGDARALPLLVDALPIDRFVAAEALGDLGDPGAIPPLLALVEPYVGSDGKTMPEAGGLRSRSRCLDLRLVLTVARALAKLGHPALGAVALRLTALRDPQELDEARLVRAAAATALHYHVTPGVASALRGAALDPDVDTARAGLLGMLYLGRKTEAQVWIDLIAAGSATATHAAWCLERWSGETLPRDDEGEPRPGPIATWWLAAASRFRDGVAYRAGVPVDLARLIQELPSDPKTIRPELKLRTGARPVHDLLAGNPVSSGELAALASWWQTHAARFPAGKLHRWGRTFEPSEVD